jgi:hypothetical protein
MNRRRRSDQHVCLRDRPTGAASCASQITGRASDRGGHVVNMRYAIEQLIEP